MTIEEVSQAQDLMLVLAESLLKQQEAINNLKVALDNYRAFLQEEINRYQP